MPKVGKKSYPYTKKGVARAKAAAKRKGVKVGRKKNKSKELNCIGYPHDDPYGLIAAWWKIFSKPQGKKEAPKKISQNILQKIFISELKFVII